jgi:hypothetical protein
MFFLFYFIGVANSFSAWSFFTLNFFNPVDNMHDYIYLVPFVKDDTGARFLKTIIPSRKATKDYLGEKKP